MPTIRRSGRSGGHGKENCSPSQIRLTGLYKKSKRTSCTPENENARKKKIARLYPVRADAPNSPTSPSSLTTTAAELSENGGHFSDLGACAVPDALSLIGNPFHAARAAMRRSTPSIRMSSREAEIDSITTYTKFAAEKGMLYVVGPPGTGKTMAATLVIERFREECPKQPVITINCMHLRRNEDIFNRIMTSLGVRKDSEDDERVVLENYLSSSPNILLVLDEIDCLIHSGTNVYDTLLSWSSDSALHISMIGIANTLDLAVQKEAPKGVQSITFKPYASEQIISIIQSRLEGIDLRVNPAAIKLCSMAVASTTGDIRQALDICRRAIEFAEQEYEKERHVLGVVNPNAAPPCAGVTIKHFAKVLSANRGLTDTATRLRSLTLQQKAVLCAAVAVRREHGVSNVGKLYSTYVAICQRDKLLRPVGQADFFSIVYCLEDVGILSLGPSFGLEKSTTATFRQRIAKLEIRDADIMTNVVYDNDILKRLVQ